MAKVTALCKNRILPFWKDRCWKSAGIHWRKQSFKICPYLYSIDLTLDKLNMITVSWLLLYHLCDHIYLQKNQLKNSF